MSECEELEVTKTEDWNWNKEYNVQLPEAESREYLPDVSHGDLVLVESTRSGTCHAIFGKVDTEETDHVDDGQVGIGLDLRQAIGVPKGGRVRVVDTPRPEDWRRQLGDVLGRRPILCRVRKAVHPDIGFDVCRLSRSAMDDLGVTPGDHVVVESTEDVDSLKALPLRDETVETKQKQLEQHPSRYPDPAEALRLDRITGTDVDIPSIYLDAERREELGLGEQATVDPDREGEAGSETSNPALAAGVCQPVKVSRNSASSFLRSLNDNTVPVVAGLLGTVVVFKGYLTLQQEVAAVGVGVVLIVLSVTYRVRTAVA
ncbi:MAG: hypothetical protein J07HB67_00988 [halophilic archaeon J07HB67]|jgi:hypothetical protein|nr:MAG: hypothetical protein J07HB67_00988 [halophilic archaeon J07HB67]